MKFYLRILAQWSLLFCIPTGLTVYTQAALATHTSSIRTVCEHASGSCLDFVILLSRGPALPKERQREMAARERLGDQTCLGSNKAVLMPPVKLQTDLESNKYSVRQ